MRISTFKQHFDIHQRARDRSRSLFTQSHAHLVMSTDLSSLESSSVPNVFLMCSQCVPNLVMSTDLSSVESSRPSSACEVQGSGFRGLGFRYGIPIRVRIIQVFFCPWKPINAREIAVGSHHTHTHTLTYNHPPTHTRTRPPARPPAHLIQ
jgi:hypothetical protein